jgi:hypothetical protein
MDHAFGMAVRKGTTEMNLASASRLIAYGVGLVASILALAGYAKFDIQTGTLDILPFNISVVTTWVITAFTNALAAVALLRGWGRK